MKRINILVAIAAILAVAAVCFAQGKDKPVVKEEKKGVVTETKTAPSTQPTQPTPQPTPVSTPATPGQDKVAGVIKKRLAKKATDYSALVYKQNQRIIADQAAIKEQNATILANQQTSSGMLARIESGLTNLTSLVTAGFAAMTSTLAAISVATGFSYTFLWWTLMVLIVIGILLVVQGIRLTITQLNAWQDRQRLARERERLEASIA